MPDFSIRTASDEMMDDFSITDERLTVALDDLRKVNLLLGGYHTVVAALRPVLPALVRRLGRPVRLLDVGTGVADIPEQVLRWADRHGIAMEIVATDANPATVAYANAALQARLPERLRASIRAEVADGLALPYEAGAFDVVTSSMFMHHLDFESAVAHVRSISRVAGSGIVINDLHRHPLAFYGIKLLAPMLSRSSMFRHDGPLSVLRGFRRSELEAVAGAAGLERYTIRWRWGFRWCLSTLR